MKQIQNLITTVTTVLLATGVQAGILSVNTTADEDDLTADPGAGAGTSLREAVNYSRPGDRIVFEDHLAGGTITLHGGQIMIAHDLEIDASGLPGRLTVAGGGGSRVFEVTTPTAATLKSLWIKNGVAPTGGGDPWDGYGGAILNHGDLVLRECAVLYSSATYGGGICNAGRLHVRRSTIAGNEADQGGGINHLSGDLVGMAVILRDSTVHDNIASDGAAVFTSGSLEATNVTIARNTASTYGGAIYGDSGAVTDLLHVTVSANTGYGGAVYSVKGADLFLNSTIVAGNSGSGLTTLDPDLVAYSSSGSLNLVGGDPELAPLGRYGGPTRVMPLLGKSPAIDGSTHTTATPGRDQIGQPRLAGEIPDIGAVEFFVAP